VIERRPARSAGQAVDAAVDAAADAAAARSACPSRPQAATRCGPPESVRFFREP
jgi:hypothetical protein